MVRIDAGSTAPACLVLSSCLKAHRWQCSTWWPGSDLPASKQTNACRTAPACLDLSGEQGIHSAEAGCGCAEVQAHRRPHQPALLWGAGVGCFRRCAAGLGVQRGKGLLLLLRLCYSGPASG